VSDVEATAPDAVVPEADGQWHRLHPVTPVIRGWKVLAVMLVIIVQQRADDLFTGRGMPGRIELISTVGAIVLIAVLSAVWSWLSWRRTRYQVATDAVHLHSGVVFRQQRQARLDRLQAVDVVQPLLARLLGLSELKLEVAGGAGSDVRLAYLREGEATRLRNALLARAAGVRYDTEDAPEAPQRELLAVPTDRLVLSLLRSQTTVWLAVAVAGLAVAVVVLGEPSVIIGLGPAVLGTLGAHWSSFSRGFAFRVAQSPDGVRLRHGLLESRSQTVPPGRVQAVKLTQTLLWRGPDWWRVEINVAGYGANVEGQNNESTLLPVGTRNEALTVLSLVLPDLGVEQPRELVDEGLTGTTSAGGFTCAPPSSVWVDPVAWRRNGFRVTPRALVVRGGRLTRQLVLVPHERTQSLGLTQGPLQRRLGLASMHVHSTPGPVSPVAAHLADRTAAALLDEQAERARQARSTAGPEQWMSRSAPVVPVEAPAPISEPRQDDG
jgi:putative membrane protein